MVEGLRVPRDKGELALAVLKELRLLEATYRVAQSEDYIIIPLKRGLKAEDRVQLMPRIGPFSEVSFQPTTRPRRRCLLEILNELLPPHLVALAPRSLDIIGHIAIVELPPELAGHESAVGKAILKANPQVKTVLAKVGKVEGEYRLRGYKLIAGEDRTETLHREYGCQLAVDPCKVYFSPRLAGEHWRVASQVREGEVVVDMFAGVGAFSILTAKTHNEIKVYAIDVNPYAISYLEKNIHLNHVEGKVIPIKGEASKVIEETLKGVADRIIMNLPERAVEFVGAACEALKPRGGVVHFYKFAAEPNPTDKAIQDLAKAVEKAGRQILRLQLSKVVKEIAPREWQVAVDAFII
ncbi:MAG: class I SAM-dependent methyltransferase family protein [Candidatus Bathyarchaeia archaeon]